MIEPIDTDAYDEPAFAPAPDSESEAGATVFSDSTPATQELDYERIIGGVTERIAQAAQQYQMQQVDASNPYDEVGDLIWENPAEAIQRTVDLATRNAVQAMMPFVQPVSQSFAVHQVTQGLSEEGQSFVHQFIREKGIDPSLLNDPTVADLVRSKAELHQIRRQGQAQAIPWTESASSYPLGHVDSQTQRELGAIERLYRNLNLKFEPAKLLGRMK